MNPATRKELEQFSKENGLGNVFPCDNNGHVIVVADRRTNPHLLMRHPDLVDDCETIHGIRVFAHATMEDVRAAARPHLMSKKGGDYWDSVHKTRSPDDVVFSPGFSPEEVAKAFEKAAKNLQ